VWLNASMTALGMTVPVFWPYPAADAAWLAHLSGGPAGVRFAVLPPSAGLCGLLAAIPAGTVRGAIVYEASADIDAL